MSDIGPLKHFLGVQIVQNKDEGKIFMNQQAYAERVLNKFGLSDANSVKSPMEANVKLIAATDDSKLCDPVLYQSAIGSLIYLASKTRPDIAFSVYKLARYCSKPSTDHWSAVKRLLRYIKGTSNYGLLFSKQCSDECVGFTDADWAGNLEDRKSTSGYCFIMNGSCICWNYSKQNCVALSTAESEYIALSCAVQEACWLTSLFTELDYKYQPPMKIFEDNTAAISIANDSQCTRKTKHIDIKFNFVRDEINKNKICLKYCKSEDMAADVLTKSLTPDKFVKTRKMAGVIDYSLV